MAAWTRFFIQQYPPRSSIPVGLWLSTYQLSRFQGPVRIAAALVLTTCTYSRAQVCNIGHLDKSRRNRICHQLVNSAVGNTVLVAVPDKRRNVRTLNGMRVANIEYNRRQTHRQHFVSGESIRSPASAHQLNGWKTRVHTRSSSLTTADRFTPAHQISSLSFTSP